MPGVAVDKLYISKKISNLVHPINFMLTIDVPVKPFVAKYIYARYGLKPSSPWILDRKDRIGKIMFNMLEPVPKGPMPMPPNLGAELKVYLIRDYVRNQGIHLSNSSIKEFTEQIQQELIEEIAFFIARVQNGTGLKKYDKLYVSQTSEYGKSRTRAIINPDVAQYYEMKEIINDIFEQYDITEEEYAFDTIHKQLRRLKLPLLSA
jgi:hypothetical protein